MKKIIALLILALVSANAHAGEMSKGESRATPPANTVSHAAPMQEDQDGELQVNEYEVVSTNGAITRAFCPYTCEMRGLEAKHCKAWRSLKDPNLCYVQDTRLPSKAIPWGSGDQRP